MDNHSIFTNLSHIEQRSTKRIRWFLCCLIALFVSAAFWPDIEFFEKTSHYLSLHIAMETFSVTIAGLIFALQWNIHTPERPNNFLFLACAFLAVGILDFLHFLSYPGMPEFITPSSTEKAINFWLLARLIVAVSLLIIAINPWKTANNTRLRDFWVLITLVLVAMSSWFIIFRQDDLPRTFIPDQGLTLFKISFEYLIVTLHFIAAYLLWDKRDKKEGIDLEILAIASFVMGLAELFFTFYTTATGLYNLAGHIYKTIAYIMIYQAVFVGSVKEPYERLQKTSLMRLKLTQFAVDHSADMVFWIKENGRIANANNAALTTLDYRFYDLTQLHLSNIEKNLTYQGWCDIWQQIVELKQLQRESTFQTASGKQIPVEMTCNHVAFGDIEYLCAFVHDISERKRTEFILKNNEFRLKEAQKLAHVGSWELDLETDKLTWTDEIFRIFEIDQASFKASYQAFLNAIHPEDREKVDSVYKTSLTEHKPYVIRHRLLLKKGKVKHVIENGQTLYTEEGKPIRSVGTVQDITTIVESEEALKNVNRQLTERANELLEQQNKARLLNEMSQLILTCKDAQECYSVAVSFCKRLFSGSSGILFILDPLKEHAQIVASWGENFSITTDFDVQECWTLRRGHTNQVDEPDKALVCPHIKKLPNAGYIGLPIHAQGELIGAIELFWPTDYIKLNKKKRESTKDFQIKIAHTLVDHLALVLINLRLRDSLQKQAIHDPLTGLYNRRYLDDVLKREINRAMRNLTHFAVIMADIDYFKKVNDQYGHDAGDALLRDIANQFQRYLRSEDLVCRYGGEEFVILLLEVNVEEATRRIEEIRTHIEQRIVEFAGKQIHVTLSAGISIYPTHGKTADDLIKVADDALYEAKNSGRNKVIAADSRGGFN